MNEEELFNNIDLNIDSILKELLSLKNIIDNNFIFNIGTCTKTDALSFSIIFTGCLYKFIRMQKISQEILDCFLNKSEILDSLQINVDADQY